MLVDAMTKNMVDVLLGKLRATGSWKPDEWELFPAKTGEEEPMCGYLECPCLSRTDDVPCWWHLPLIPDDEVVRGPSGVQVYFLRK